MEQSTFLYLFKYLAWLFSEDKFVIEDSTEFVNHVAICGPKLPIRLKNHCFFKLNTSFALIAGGQTEVDLNSELGTKKTVLSGQTLYYSIHDRTFTFGPNLRVPRFARNMHKSKYVTKFECRLGFTKPAAL